MPTDALKSIMKYADIIQVFRQELDLNDKNLENMRLLSSFFHHRLTSMSKLLLISFSCKI
jgi:hypothetical protein